MIHRIQSPALVLVLSSALAALAGCSKTTEERCDDSCSAIVDLGCEQNPENCLEECIQRSAEPCTEAYLAYAECATANYTKEDGVCDPHLEKCTNESKTLNDCKFN